MNKSELVQSLIDMVNGLPDDDLEGLKVIYRRADGILRKVFDNPEVYMRELRNIDFSIGFGPCFPPINYTRKSLRRGKNELLKRLTSIMEDAKLVDTSPEAGETSIVNMENSKRVFIVHGHDEGMKQAVARILEKLGLEPIILHEQPNQGRTIIEKFTDYSDVGFAIVLLSPDDICYPKELRNEVRPRARQNVIFELGFFIGKLGRNRVLALYRESKDFEMPSDYSGVLYNTFDNMGQWRLQVVQELKACGYNV